MTTCLRNDDAMQGEPRFEAAWNATVRAARRVREHVAFVLVDEMQIQCVHCRHLRV